jgi:hypothetical protein
VDLSADLDAMCTPETLFAQVADLARYPDWFAIVDKAVPQDEGQWLVDLRGRLGPMARSKRLRMVRTVCSEPVRVRFERAELDGRNHSAWVLDATVAATDVGARLTVDLHYGGSFGGALLRRMLLDEIEQARPRLAALVAG